MTGLLKIKNDYSWDITDIDFAIEERVGEPKNFFGRKKEMEYLYSWYKRIKSKTGSSIAFLGRRKIGKSLMMERLYNIIYSEQDGVIPFYYEFKEGKITAYKFAEDFIVRFFMQVIGYYTRDKNWIRDSINKKTKYNISDFLENVKTLDFIHKDYILKNMNCYINVLEHDKDEPYELVKLATSIPDAFATDVSVDEKVIQIIDEFQYLNSEIDAGREEIPSKCYMSTAESKVAPLLVTGSLMGVIAHDLMKYTPQRFNVMNIPKMDENEAKAMTKNYGKIFGHSLTDEAVDYIVSMTNNVPGRIVNLLEPNVHKRSITSIEDIDETLYYEVTDGKIKGDWEEYLALAMDNYNDKNMKLITYYLCKNEKEYYFPSKLKEKLSLDISDKKLRNELEILHRYDLIEKTGGQYGGVFDRTLKHVLMTNYADILNLPTKGLIEYFKGNNQLTYLQERIKELQLSLETKEALNKKFNTIQGLLNEEKGKRFEMTVLIKIIRHIINNKAGIVSDINVDNFDFHLNYHLKTGQEIDIIIESPTIIIAVECKNYNEDNIERITIKTVDVFIEKYNKLTDEYPGKEIRTLYISKNGFTGKTEKYLQEKGISSDF